jgi:4-hydroxy-tetrahydrodipicolinate synthase
MQRTFEGVLIPVCTPFGGDGAPQERAFVRHCRWLLAQGASGLAVFGTTSEANSLSVAERRALLEALAGDGIDGARLLPGTGACALPDAVELTRAALAAGARGVLMLPPFYYKAVSDEGLFAFFAEVIERVGSGALRLYLYHIPPVAQVSLSFTLIERLLARYPGVVAGVKDSSGDFKHTQRLNDVFPGLEIFAGSESFLLANLRAGGAGCITASGNINVAAIAQLARHWQDPDADQRQDRLTRLRRVVESFPVIAAVKCVLAQIHRDPLWCRTRPPLVDLPQHERERLLAGLQREGFAPLAQGFAA